MRSLLLIILAAIFSACNSKQSDLIITNATIWTGDSAMPEADAMAISGDSIVSVGTIEEVMQWKSDNTEVIHAGGGFITPGFIDAHVHFLTGGMQLASVQLRDAKTPVEFIQRIKDYVATVPAGTWIQGGAWDHENWGGQLPEAAWIDSVTPNNPVFILRLDGHMALANTAAMLAAGVSAATTDVKGGTIVRYADRRPAGVFKDNAMDLITKAVPAYTTQIEDRALQAAMEYVSSNGVTTIANMGDFGGVKDIEIFERARTNNQLITRAYVSMPLASWPQLKHRVDANGKGDKWVSIGVLKGFADGSLGSHTAAFKKLAGKWCPRVGKHYIQRMVPFVEAKSKWPNDFL